MKKTSFTDHKLNFAMQAISINEQNEFPTEQNMIFKPINKWTEKYVTLCIPFQVNLQNKNIVNQVIR